MDAPRQYLEEARSELSQYPTWLPGDTIELGAFGTFHRGAFVVDGRLADRDIPVVVKQHRDPSVMKKSRRVKFRRSLDASAKSGAFDAELGVDLEIEKEHAWVFAARCVSRTQIANIDEVRRAVLEAHKAGTWERRWLIVSEVRHAEHLNVVIARGRGHKIKVSGKGTVMDPFDVLLQVDASFESSSEDVLHVQRSVPSTPLYSLRKLRGFLDPRVQPISGTLPLRGDELEIVLDEPMFP